jgi:hypothetical protein
MVQISGEESHLELKAAENVDITDLLLFIENLMAEIDGLNCSGLKAGGSTVTDLHQFPGLNSGTSSLVSICKWKPPGAFRCDGVKNPFADDDDTEEAEEHEYDGWTLAEEVKRYQKEFQKYAEVIKGHLENTGYQLKRPLKNDKVGEYYKNATQTLPKPEAGKSAFEFKDFSIPDFRKSPFEEEKTEMHRNEHNHDHSDYPCGGKLRGMFRHGFLKYTLEGINKDRGMMNYLAV